MITPGHQVIRHAGHGALAAGVAAAAFAVVERSRSRGLTRRLQAKDRLLLTLQDRLAIAETQLRSRQSRMHEVSATVGALASATELLPTLDMADRLSLWSMLDAELQRLRRLLDRGVPVTGPAVAPTPSSPGPNSPAPTGPIVVDEVIDRLVLAHRIQGRQVVWRAGATRALGDADALAEAVNVLLENAARHGAADDIDVTVLAGEHRVEVVVGDGGPGIPEDLRAEIFTWGVRRPGSPGQGIGLPGARDRLRACGGNLRLSGDRDRTRFVIELAAAERSTTSYQRMLAG